MISHRQVEMYRRMSPEERYLLFLQLAEEGWRSLMSCPPHIADRKWELIRKHHEEGCRLLEEKFKQLS